MCILLRMNTRRLFRDVTIKHVYHDNITRPMWEEVYEPVAAGGHDNTRRHCRCGGCTYLRYVRRQAKLDNTSVLIRHRRTGMFFLCDPGIDNIRRGIAVLRGRVRAARNAARTQERPQTGIRTFRLGRRDVRVDMAAALAGDKAWKRDFARTDFGPITRAPHLGIELECGVLDDMTGFDALVDAVADAGLSVRVTAGSDGSVRVAGRYPAEFRLCTTEARMRELVGKTCGMLRGIKARANDSCGLHVHLDMRSRDWQESYQRLFAQLPWLYAMQPRNRWDNGYCKYPEQTPDMGDRYYAINACSVDEHNTLEVRLHSGTVAYDKITSWCDILKAIIDCPAAAVPITKFSELVDTLKLSTQVAGHMKRRIQRFEAIGKPRRARSRIGNVTPTLGLELS